jgi:hypothetical protein
MIGHDMTAPDDRRVEHVESLTGDLLVIATARTNDYACRYFIDLKEPRFLREERISRGRRYVFEGGKANWNEVEPAREAE